jgi:hypothetical protein
MSGGIVYGLRVCGEVESRYVGATHHSLSHRLRKHFDDAARRATPLARWLSANRGRVEIFEIASFPESAGRARVFAHERATIASLLRLNHRLLNRMHVPHGLRVA